MANWTGAVNDKWSEPLNWDTSAVPTSSEYCFFYTGSNLIIDVDVDVKVQYISLGSNIASFNMNDKTIECLYSFDCTVSGRDVINSGTSTLVIGNSGTSAFNSYCSFNPGLGVFYKVITYNDCSFYNSTTSFLNTSGAAKINHSLKSYGVINFIPNYPQTIAIIDCPLIDLADCFASSSNDENNWKIFKNSTNIIGPSEGIFRDKTAFIINASANNDIINLPSGPTHASNGAFILSPFDFDTNQYYSGVTFITPSTGYYGLDGCEHLFEDTYTISTGGLYCFSATLNFSANNSDIRADALCVSGCNLILNPNKDLYINSTLRVMNASTITNTNKKIIFDASFRNMFGSYDKILNASINSTVRLPDIVTSKYAIAGSFIGCNVSANNTPLNHILKASSSFTGSMNLSGDLRIIDYSGSMTTFNVSANSLLISGSDYDNSNIFNTCSFRTTSGSKIYNMQCQNFTITSGAISAYNCFPHPYYGFPTSLFVNNDSYTTTVWTNSGGDNKWSTASNWTSGVPTSSMVAAFDKNVTSATCILDISTTVFGISGKPYTTNTINANWYWPGALRFNDNVILTIRRYGNFWNIGNVSATNDMDLCTVLLKDASDSTAKVYFSTCRPTVTYDRFPNIQNDNDTYYIFGSEIFRNARNVNILAKYVGGFEAGTSSTSTSAYCNVFYPNGYIAKNFNLRNSKLGVWGPLTKPFGGVPNFIVHNVNAFTVPNFYYPFGVSFTVPSVNSSFTTTIKFETGMVPNINSIQLLNSASPAIFDLTDHTEFGSLTDSGTGYSNVNNKVILPNSKFYAASIPTNSLYNGEWQLNSLVEITNEYLPIESRTYEIYAPSNSFGSILSGAKIIVSGSDKYLNITSRIKCQSFSAIGCKINHPWNVYPTNGLNYYDTGITAIDDILISGCITSGLKKITSADLHSTAGYKGYFEAGGFVLSSNKVVLNDIDFKSNGYSSLVYSNVTPSAINVNLKKSTAMATSGDARFATNLGGNVNWKFINEQLLSVVPDEGTSWYRTVMLSGSDLDSANIYFNGELLTNFLTLTPTSATVVVPLMPPGQYNFYLG